MTRRKASPAKPKLYPPDWDRRAVAYGGHLTEVCKPHVRFYRDGPARRKRVVQIETVSFCEIGSVGAKHLYVTITEDFDRLWDAVDRCWRECWDDTCGAGRQINAPRLFIYGRDEAASAQWVKKQLAKHFPPAAYAYEFNSNSLSRKLKRAVGRIARDGD